MSIDGSVRLCGASSHVSYACRGARNGVVDTLQRRTFVNNRSRATGAGRDIFNFQLPVDIAGAAACWSCCWGGALPVTGYCSVTWKSKIIEGFNLLLLPGLCAECLRVIVMWSRVYQYGTCIQVLCRITEHKYVPCRISMCRSSNPDTWLS